MHIVFEHRPFDDLKLRDLYEILWLRDEVFVVGQRITAESEVDGMDPQCVHVYGRLAEPGGEPYGRVVATARLFDHDSEVKVGRIAVAPQLQQKGVGRQLMHYVHTVLGKRAGKMSAQAHLRDWYGGLGWQANSGIYMEADIPHIAMTRPAGR
jgi:ElaA protein